MVMSTRSAFLLSRGWLSKSAPASVVVHTLRVQSVVLSASSLSEGPCIFNNELYFALAKGSGQCLVEHPIVSERAPSLCKSRSAIGGVFVPVLEGGGTKISLPGDIFGQPLREMS